jgi:hypothetical protein
MTLNKADLLGGAMFTVLGAAVLYIVQDYTLGDARRVSPGYFPMLIGGLLVFVGLLMMALSLRGPSAGLPKLEWRAVAPIILAISEFMAGIAIVGLLPAIVITLVLSSLADCSTSWRDILIRCVTVPIAVWLIFIGGLGMSIPFLEVGF